MSLRPDSSIGGGMPPSRGMERSSLPVVDDGRTRNYSRGYDNVKLTPGEVRKLVGGQGTTKEKERNLKQKASDIGYANDMTGGSQTLDASIDPKTQEGVI